MEVLKLSPTKTKFTLPELSYAYKALEPHIDAKTMEIHHTKHHQGYVDKLNKALEDHPDYQNLELHDLLKKHDSLPNELKAPVRKHGGGHANHTLFWRTMSPDGGGEPSGDLATDIAGKFGSFESFKDKFKEAATSQFGSGWAWLLIKDGTLSIESTANQDSPWMENKVPILGVDVWEHAYYLKHQNKRADWIDDFFKVIDWDAVGSIYEKVQS
jgi:superoxide dismutase, Fe-Mn family